MCDVTRLITDYIMNLKSLDYILTSKLNSFSYYVRCFVLNIVSIIYLIHNVLVKKQSFTL